MCNWDFSTTGGKSGRSPKTENHAMSLPLQRPLHNVPNSIFGRLARVQNSVNLFRDRHFDSMFAGQRQQRRGGIHSLGNHAHIREDFAERTSFAEFDSHKAIAAERARASE